MKVIVGLGNPGPHHDRTRHNVGFEVVDRVASQHMPECTPRSRFHGVVVEGRIADETAMLIKPMTYMNRSGLCVREAIDFYKLDPAESLLIVVDDVALPCGVIRLRSSGGSGGHNGLSDIEQRLGSSEYARLRIGIDSPGPIPQRDYVLGRFSPDQRDAVEPALDEAADAVTCWCRQGIIAAMNQFNRRQSTEERPKEDHHA